MEAGTVRNTSPLTAILLVCGAALIAWQSILLLRLFDPHDQSWYLIGAERLLHGTKLYGPDFSETNPPLIVWFSIVPVLLSHYTSLSPVTCLRLVMLLMIATSTWVSFRILRRQLGTAGEILTVPVVMALTASFFLMDLYDFGQREQLMVALVLPYLLGLARVDLQSRSEWVWLGLAAGVGVCMKPQQALAIVAAETYAMISTRSLRRLWSPGVLALAATGTVYIGLVVFLTPLYLSQTVPDLLNCYWAFGSASGVFFAIHTRGRAEVLTLLLLTACVLWQAKLRLARPAAILLAASLGASAAFCIQHTGWIYQGYPAKATLWLAALLLGIDVAWPRVIAGGKVIQLTAGLALVLAAISLGIASRRAIPTLGMAERGATEQVLAPMKPGDSITNLSMFANPLPELASHHLRWGSGYYQLWKLPAIVQNELGPAGGRRPFKRLEPDVLHSLELRQRQEVADDLARWHPTWVVVERCTAAHRCPETGQLEFDTVAWMMQGAAFRKEWAAYRRSERNDVFDVYRRLP